MSFGAIPARHRSDHRSARPKGGAIRACLVRAVAADSPVAAPVPVLHLDDTAAITDFIAREVGP